tara:strand:+ start:5264 stop:5563 length:300 start_codon:yes stop_codon:yes gene_type:complete
MKDEKEKWIEDIFDSMKGSSRAEVPGDLFAKIQQEIKKDEPKVKPLFQWKYVAAAAVVLIFINLTSVFMYTQKSKLLQNETRNTEVYSEPLISTYQIYE